MKCWKYFVSMEFFPGGCIKSFREMQRRWGRYFISHRARLPVSLQRSWCSPAGKIPHCCKIFSTFQQAKNLIKISKFGYLSKVGSCVFICYLFFLFFFLFCLVGWFFSLFYLASLIFFSFKKNFGFVFIILFGCIYILEFYLLCYAFLLFFSCFYGCSTLLLLLDSQPSKFSFSFPIFF